MGENAPLHVGEWGERRDRRALAVRCYCRRLWLLISEIYPLNVRGTAMSLATVANWTANFLVAVTFLSFVNVLT